MLHPSHEPSLVALSFVVACLGSYAALQLASRVVVASGPTRTLWLVGSAFTMGVGIWSMHFVAMVAFRLGVPIAYSLDLVILSVLVAIAASLLAFVTVSRRTRPGPGTLSIASVLMGPAIAGMHYIGMAAVRSAATIDYDSMLVALSVIIAITASFAALRLFISFRDPAVVHPMWAKPGSAVLMGVAISGMHYTGMAAATFIPAAGRATSGFLIASDGLAYAVGGSATFIAGTAVLAVLLDQSVRAQIAAARRVETEQRRVAEALRQSQERLQFALSAARMTAWEFDLKTSMIYRPDASASSAGAATEHLSAFLERVHPDDRARFDAALQRAAADGGFDLDYRLMGPDDSVRWINAKGQVATPERGQGQRIVGLSTDITDRRQLEEQFRQAQKMEAVGQLAGGIAHDFNNLLTVIKGNCEMLLVTEPTEACREAITEVLTASDRAAALTHQLLTFSRKQVMQLRPLDVNAVIRDLEPMLRRLIGEHIAVDTRLDPSLTMAMADQGQIEQILVNLAVNARDAMAGGGALRIETANLTVDAIHRGRGVDVPPGCYVVLSVTDNGIGIARRIQPRLFEPFFTTKAAGKGTGLGLSTVYGIVKQSGGVVGVESEPGKGATFTAYLPCAPAAMLHATPREGPRAKEPGGTETILLAEDETALRRLVRQVLERQGYHVLESSDGAAALATADAYQGRIDALVTDVVMPVMGGRELSERLRDRRPDVKVLFMSGYSNEDIAGIAMTNPLVTFLQKPFVPKALVGAVRDLLDAPMPRHKV